MTNQFSFLENFRKLAGEELYFALNFTTMKQLFLALALISFLSCNSSKSKIDSTAQKSTRVDYAQTITAEDLRTHLFKFADDKMQGRMTGTGPEMAAAYLKTFYLSQGIGSPFAGRRLFSEIPSSYFNKSNKYKDSENVVAFIPGSEFPKKS